MSRIKLIFAITFLSFLFFMPRSSRAMNPTDVTGFSITRGRFPLSRDDGSIPLPPPALYYTSFIYGNLHNSNNFGTQGVVPCTININGMVHQIEPGSLVDNLGSLKVDVFFGNPIDTPLSISEAIELKKFVESGGILYVSGMGWSTNTPGKGPEYNLLFDVLGLNDHYSSSFIAPGLVQSDIPLLSPVTDGPFGRVGPLRHSSFRVFNHSYLKPIIGVNGLDESIAYEAKIGKGYLVVTGEALYVNSQIGDLDNLNYYLNLFSLPCRDDWRGGESEEVVLDVPSFKQGLSPFDGSAPLWEDSPYDNAGPDDPLRIVCDTNQDGATIAECGCAMTSAAMVAKYHGIELAADASEVNPETLNYYLRQGLDLLGANGFYNGNVVWHTISNFTANSLSALKERFGDSFTQPKLEMPVREDFSYQRVKELIDDGQPVIQKVTGDAGEHWVVIKGYDPNTERLIINDPINPDPTGDNHSYLDELYTPVETGSMIIYRQTNSDFRYLQFATAFPNTLEVTDKDGVVPVHLKTAFDQYYYNQSNEGGVHFYTIEFPEDGIYKVKTKCVGSFAYPFTVYSSNKEGELTSKSFIPKCTETEYQFVYDQENAGNEIVQLVDIEVRPFSTDKKIVAKSNAAIPVAIYSSSAFDATTIAENSLAFGIKGEEQSLHFCTYNDQDINKDGLLDKLCWFRVGQLSVSKLTQKLMMRFDANDSSYLGVAPVLVK